MGMNIMDANQKLNEYIQSYSGNEKIYYAISNNHLLEFGIRSELLRVKSGDMKISNSRQLEIRSGWMNAAWLGYEGSFYSILSLSLGARLSCYTALSGNIFHDFVGLNESSPDYSSKTYLHTEPRGSIKFNINDNHNIKIGASISTQALHGIRSTTTTFPFDRYALASAFTKPEVTTQYSISYAGMTTDGTWDWTCEGYYKNMTGVYDYKDGVTMFSRINLESLILSGNGRSYGMEFMLRKNIGKFTGWVSYTLSKTDTRISGINNGQWYKASNDRRNDISLVGIYIFNNRLNASLSWTYSSGRPLTAPDEKYILGGETCYYYSARNSYKTPPSHRLDLSVTYTKASKLVTSIFAFGVFNAYAHYSPFVIYFEDDPTKPSGTRAVQQSLFGIVPSISYTIKF